MVSSQAGAIVDEQMFNWIVGGVATVVAALSTVVVTLWRKTEKQHEQTMQLHKECEDDRKVLHAQVGNLEGQVKELRRQLGG